MRLHALTTICKQNDNYKITGAPGFPPGRLALAKNDTAKTRRLPAAIRALSSARLIFAPVLDSERQLVWFQSVGLPLIERSRARARASGHQSAEIYRNDIDTFATHRSHSSFTTERSARARRGNLLGISRPDVSPTLRATSSHLATPSRGRNAPSPSSKPPPPVQREEEHDGAAKRRSARRKTRKACDMGRKRISGRRGEGIMGNESFEAGRGTVAAEIRDCRRVKRRRASSLKIR